MHIHANLMDGWISRAAWIEAILGISFDAPFEEFLKDGIVLCNLINAIKPGSVSRINRMRQPFMLMENIEVCRGLCVCLFDPVVPC